MKIYWIYADFIHIEAAWVPYVDLHEAGLVLKHVPDIPPDFEISNWPLFIWSS